MNASIALPLAALVVVLGCAARPNTSVTSNLEVLRREQAADKLLERGRAFAAMGDYTRAEQYLSLSLEAGARISAVLPLLIRVCVEGERYLAALEYARLYASKDPDDPHLTFVVASLEAAVGDSNVALAELRSVVRVMPAHCDAHYALATLVRDSRGDPYEADRHFREYLRLAPTGPHAGEARASLLRSVP